MARKHLLEVFRAPDYHGYVMVKWSDLPIIRAHISGHILRKSRNGRQGGARRKEERAKDQAMSERNAPLAEAIAARLEHITKGLRQWAQAQRAVPERSTSPIPAAPDGGDRLVKVKEAAQCINRQPDQALY